MIGLLNFAAGIGSSAIGGLTNMLFGKATAERNAKINYKYNEMAAEAADKRTRALYENYMSPASRIAQLKAAGLSPSLYADGAGAGSQGVTAGAQGAGATGVGIPTNFMSAGDLANIRLANAQATKAEAEADTLKGNNERGEAEITKIWAEAGATKAAEKLTQAEESLKRIDLYIAEETKDFSITRTRYNCDKAMDEARLAYWEAEDAGLTFQFNAATFEKRAEEQATRCVELANRAALEHSQTQLNETEKNALKQYVKQGWYNIAVSANNSASYAKQVEAYADNLPKQIELRKTEIGLEKWRIGVDAFNHLVSTAGYIIGGSYLGQGGTNTEEVIKHHDGKGNTTSTTTHQRTTKRMPRGFKLK